jgi:hypothetical protein
MAPKKRPRHDVNGQSAPDSTRTAPLAESPDAGSTGHGEQRTPSEPPAGAEPEPAVVAEPVVGEGAEPSPEPEVSWPTLINEGTESEIRGRFIKEVNNIISNSEELADSAVLAILRPDDSINAFDLDQIYEALMDLDSAKYKNVVLILLSQGGEIEPAYQISKLCKTFARQYKFLVVVPRQAKSAATLIALGADEIHIGPLGQLGPIDPQIGGLPALGVSQALQTIASLVQQYPKSADMFAQYLRMAVKVEHIGYSDRVTASAVQYAERLLASKPHLAARIPEIAKHLVYAYKDHSFVIDAEESQRLLGTEFVKMWSALEGVAEQIYSHFDWANLWLPSSPKKKRLVVTGAFNWSGVLLFRA